MTTQDYNALIDSYGGHFNISEFEIQGRISRLDGAFLRSFLTWRQWHGIKTLVTSAWRAGNRRSAHGHGLALDCMLFDVWLSSQPTALQHWLAATTWPFQGVGLYFDWHYRRNGQRVPGVGLHVDGWDGGTVTQRPLRWLRIDGNYYYQSRVTGAFFCRAINQSITLTKAIEDYTHEQKNQ